MSNIETIHIAASHGLSPFTLCGRDWANNSRVGAVRPSRLPEYRPRAGIRICPDCDERNSRVEFEVRHLTIHHCGHRYDDHGRHGCTLCHCAFVPVRELAQ